MVKLAIQRAHLSSLTFRIRRACCHSNETRAPIANPPRRISYTGQCITPFFIWHTNASSRHAHRPRYICSSSPRTEAVVTRNIVISVLQCCDTVGRVIRPVKLVPDMTYNVFGGTLKLAQLNYTKYRCRFLDTAHLHGVTE